MWPGSGRAARSNPSFPIAELNMRTVLSALLPVCLLLGGSGAAPAQEVRDIIQKAIKAHGADALNKYKAGQTRTKGQIELLGGLPFTQEMIFQLPNQFREVSELEAGGQKVPVITVFNGNEGWIKVNGKTQDLDEKLRGELK